MVSEVPPVQGVTQQVLTWQVSAMKVQVAHTGARHMAQTACRSLRGKTQQHTCMCTGELTHAQHPYTVSCSLFACSENHALLDVLCKLQHGVRFMRIMFEHV